MTNIPQKSDRIFNGLSERFIKKIYANNNLKGMIRLHILHTDLNEHLPDLADDRPLMMLDAGGGIGNISIWLAQQGHQVTLLEPSTDMLIQAQNNIAKVGYMRGNITLVNNTIQGFVNHSSPAEPLLFDWITCHAVMEWLATPKNTLQQLLTLLKPGGILSLMFFNHYSKELRHLQGGDLKAVLEQRLSGDGKKALSPISPLNPPEVASWLTDDHHLHILTWSGIRCFYDYAHPEVRKHMDTADVLALESQYARQDPWRQIARYQHMLCQKPLDCSKPPK